MAQEYPPKPTAFLLPPESVEPFWKAEPPKMGDSAGLKALCMFSGVSKKRERMPSCDGCQSHGSVLRGSHVL